MSLFSNTDDAELFRRTIDQGPDAVIVTDLQGQIRIWNKAAAKLFGYSHDEAIGRNLNIIIPEHLRKAHWEGFGQAMASGRTKYGGRALRSRASHKSGDKLYVNIAFSILRGRDDGVVGAVATAREAAEK